MCVLVGWLVVRVAESSRECIVRRVEPVVVRELLPAKIIMIIVKRQGRRSLAKSTGSRETTADETVYRCVCRVASLNDKSGVVAHNGETELYIYHTYCTKIIMLYMLYLLHEDILYIILTTRRYFVYHTYCTKIIMLYMLYLLHKEILYIILTTRRYYIYNYTYCTKIYHILLYLLHEDRLSQTVPSWHGSDPFCREHSAPSRLSETVSTKPFV